MRVLQVLGTSAGGVGRHVHGLAAGLVERGHEVTVCCPAGVEEHFCFADTGARVVPVPISDRPHPRNDARATTVLREQVEQADVVHAHGLRAGALAVLAATGHDAPVVVTLHNATPQGRWTSRVYAVLERLVARRASLVLGVSADLVERQRELGATTGELAVIPAPRPPAQVTPRHTVREQLGVAEGSVLVVAVGRLAVQKGFPLLLEAASRLTDLDVLFVVAGEGPLRGALEDTITRNGLPVRLLGSRGDVPDLLGAADIVASTALWEGQPLNLQEALHAGAAIVATDVGGTGAVLGDAGVLTPSGDPEALAGALRDLVLRPERRAALQARATRRAAELPTDDDAVEAALAGYRSVTGVLGAS